VTAEEPRGLRVGIEIHQQLDTREKLFCGCPTTLREEEPDYTLTRMLKPTYSEMGSMDKAALFEWSKRMTFRYQGYRDTVCLVELDEEPPHNLNPEAISIALTVAALLKMTPADEIHVMRKLVIDGSNTTGFQRTAKVAFGGWIMDGDQRIGISSLCIEEDAARKIEGDGATYRLDRLGIPLIEITTAPDMRSGGQAERVALSIGRVLKATGRMKRGLGTIRQDLNISIEGGARVEVKGVQELGLISEVVRLEAARQSALLRIRDELGRRKVRQAGPPQDITDIAPAGSKVVRKAVESGGRVMAAVLPGFSGILGTELQPGRRFGTELSDRAKAAGGVGGIFHTDELPAYGITGEDVRRMRERLEADAGDCIIFVAAAAEKAERAVTAAVERAYEALRGVPSEVRAANPDGTTRFMRPMPGSARMYPETDVPSIVVDSALLREVSSNLPELLDAKADRYSKEYGLSRDLASLIAESPYASAFERLVRDDGLPAPSVAATYEYTFKMLRREGVDVESLDEELIGEVLRRVFRGGAGKEAVPEVLRWLASNRGKSVDDAFGALSLGAVDSSVLQEKVAEVVGRNMELVLREGERAIKPLMGDLMEAYRGKVDGKVIFGMLRDEINRALNKCGH